MIVRKVGSSFFRQSSNQCHLTARVRCENLSNELALNRAICKILTTFNRKLLYISESRAQRSYNLDCI